MKKKNFFSLIFNLNNFPNFHNRSKASHIHNNSSNNPRENFPQRPFNFSQKDSQRKQTFKTIPKKFNSLQQKKIRFLKIQSRINNRPSKRNNRSRRILQQPHKKRQIQFIFRNKNNNFTRNRNFARQKITKHKR